VAEPPSLHSQAEPAEPGNEQALIEMCITIRALPGNEIDEIMRTFKDLCSFVPKKCINKNILYSIIYKTTTLVDVCAMIEIW